MAKIDLTTTVSGFLSIEQINANFTAIENEFNNDVLYRRNPSPEPNQLLNTVDMNSNTIDNLKDAVELHQAINLGQAESILAGGPGSGGIDDIVNGDLLVNGDITLEDVLVLRNATAGISNLTITAGAHALGAGGSLTTFTQADDGDDGIMSWTVWDAAGNLRDMSLLWTGVLDIPGAINLDHQTTPAFGGFKIEWGIDVFNNPILIGAADPVTASTSVAFSGVSSTGSVSTFGTTYNGGPHSTFILTGIDNVSFDNQVAGNGRYKAHYTSSVGLPQFRIGPDGTVTNASVSLIATDSLSNEFNLLFNQLGRLLLPSGVDILVNQQAATKKYVDDTVAGGTGAILADGTVPLTANWAVGSFKITGLTDPTAAQDAATKFYVDSVVTGGGDVTVDTDLIFNHDVDVPTNGTVIAHYTTSVTPTWSIDAPAGVNNVSYRFRAHDASAVDVDFVMNALGQFIIPGSAPTSNAHATRKDYVDAADALLFPLAGGTITGNTTLADGISHIYTGPLGTATVKGITYFGDMALEFDCSVDNTYVWRGVTTGTDVALTNGQIAVLADPPSPNALSRKSYVDAQDALRLALTGGTLSGPLAMGTSKITGLGTPTVNTDASTKLYVDSTVSSGGSRIVAEGKFTTNGTGVPTLGNNKATTSVVRDTGSSQDFYKITLSTAGTSTANMKITVYGRNTGFPPGDALNAPLVIDYAIISTTRVDVHIFNTNSTTVNNNTEINFTVEEID